MAAWAIRATSRSNTSTATTAATASPKAARKSRSARSRDFCSAIWGRGSTETSLRAKRSNPFVSIHLPVLARPKGIAQMASQDLAGGVARQRLDEVDRLRRLEARDAFAGEADDIRRRRLLAGLHPRTHRG